MSGELFASKFQNWIYLSSYGTDLLTRKFWKSMRPQSQLHLLLWRLTPRRPSGRSNWGWSRPRRLLSSLSQWRPPRLWKEAGSTSVIWHWLRSRLWRSYNQVKVISMSLRGHYECLQCHMSSVSPGGWLMCVDTWARPHNGHNLWPLSRHLEPGHKQHTPVSPVTPGTQLDVDYSPNPASFQRIKYRKVVELKEFS